MKKNLPQKSLVYVLTAAMAMSAMPMTAFAEEEATEMTVVENEKKEVLGDEIPANSADFDLQNQEEDTDGETQSKDAPWDGTTVDTAWYDDHVGETEYTINTAAEFAGLAKLVNEGTQEFSGKTIKLGADIDLNDKEWAPIGGAGTGKNFKGTFLGEDHKISNLKITKELVNTGKNNCIGLFGSASGGKSIENFTLENVDVSGCLNVAAVLGGSGVAEAKVKDVTVQGDIKIYGDSYVGGILGKGYTIIDGCSVAGASMEDSYIKNTWVYVGGIVGFMGEENNQITDCHIKNISVEGMYNGIGGISGILHYGNTINGCTAENVSVWQKTDDENEIGYVGAFAGTYLNDGGKNIPNITDCIFDGYIYMGEAKNSVLNQDIYVGSLWYGAKPPTDVNITGCEIKATFIKINENYDSTAEKEIYVRTADGISALPVPEREGFQFDGWYTEAEGGEKVTALTDGMTVYAHWSVKREIKVTFQNNDGTDTSTEMTTDENGKISVLPEPSRAGYVFEGWYTAADGGEKITAETVFENDTVVFARWRKKSSGSSSSGSTSSGTTTDKVENTDGSTTTTETKPNGDKIETTVKPDGSTTVVEKTEGGKVTTTQTDAQGNKTETVETGSTVVTTVKKTDGSTSTTVKENGKTEVEVSVSKNAVQESGVTALPMPPVSVSKDSSSAAVVKVQVAENITTKVEVPVENMTPGTVAVMVKEDGTEEVVKTSLMGQNGVLLTVQGSATIKVVDNSKEFIDIDSSHWGNEAVVFSTSREIFAGTSENTFTPEGSMTRAMVWTVVARLNGVDTAEGDTWYEAGQKWAVKAGISDGTNPDGTVTREQLAAMLYRYAGEPAVSGTISGFVDGDKVSDWAEDAMLWATTNGIIAGMEDGMLNPQGTATRVQVAAIMMRFIKQTA